MTEPKRKKTVRQKAFVAEAEKAAEKGLAPSQALEVAAAKVGGDVRMAETVRPELGLDDEGLRETFGKRIAKRFLDADDGVFPAWVGEDPKAKLDYFKSIKGDLATAFITKTERHIQENDDTKHRTDAEIEHRLKYGKWPEDMELSGDAGSIQ